MYHSKRHHPFDAGVQTDHEGDLRASAERTLRITLLAGFLLVLAIEGLVLFRVLFY
jgi:hypothetical protein